jgi:hypothetical protein
MMTSGLAAATAHAGASAIHLAQVFAGCKPAS